MSNQNDFSYSPKDSLSGPIGEFAVSDSAVRGAESHAEAAHEVSPAAPQGSTSGSPETGSAMAGADAADEYGSGGAAPPGAFSTALAAAAASLVQGSTAPTAEQAVSPSSVAINDARSAEHGGMHGLSSAGAHASYVSAAAAAAALVEQASAEPRDAEAKAPAVATQTIGSAVGRQPAVVIRGLRKVFGELDALGGPVGGMGLDFTVPRGEVVGLLGPDGAGKTTLMRILCTVLRADNGDADIFGASVTEEPGKVTPRIGYMSQQFSMYPDLSIAENVDYFAALRGVPRKERRARGTELLDRMGLGRFKDRRAGALSGGMKQKLMLTTTLMHSPDLLLLDEPTTGVDPVSRREFWQILGELNAEGATVLVATPYMDEADRCHRIAFLADGLIRAEGTPAQIKAAVPFQLLEVRDPDRRAALAVAERVPGARSVHLLGDVVRVFWDPAAGDAESTLRESLTAAGLPEAEVRPVVMDMEAAYTALAETGDWGGDETTSSHTASAGEAP